MLSPIFQTLRSLRQIPGFTTVVLLTLALGIGATTAIYSVVSHVLMRPLPYPDPDRLVQVWTCMPEAQIDRLAVAHAEYLDYRAESHLIEEAGAYWVRPCTLTGAGEPIKIPVALTTSSLWRVLGIEAAMGRTLVEGDDQPGGEPIVVLSHGLWQSQLGGDPAVIGRSIELDGRTRQVVGVMPPSFGFPSQDVAAWVPFPLDPMHRQNHHLAVLARMKPGVDYSQIQPEMDAIVERWSQQYDHAHPFLAISYEEQVLGDVRQPLSILLGVVALVLLISAVNVAGLLLARGESRQRELAVRAALGSGRLALIRRLLGESLLLAVAGGALGLLVAKAGLAAIIAMEPGNLPRIDEITLDLPVLLFACGLSLLTGLLAGLIPAWRVSRPDLTSALRSGGERLTSGRQRLRSLLVVTETATAVVLVVGAALLLRSLWNLQKVDPGIKPDHLLTAQLSLPASSYGTAEEVHAFYQELEGRLQALPGVRSVALVNSLPMRDMIRMILVSGPWQPEDAEPVGADVVMVSADYLSTVGNQVVSGRPFSRQDRPGAPRVAALNETAAKALFGEVDPLGAQLSILQAQPPGAEFEVIAVIRDVPTLGVGSDVRPQIYLSLDQAVTGIRGVTRAVSVALKTGQDPGSLAGALRATIWDLDRRLAISNVETMEQVVSATLQPQRFQALLLGLFSALALILAAIGLYGLLAHIVGLRRRELGIRLAMGARPGQLRTLVLSQALGLSAVGVLLGIGGAVAGARLLEGMVYGVELTDATSMLTTVAVILLTAAGAAYVPARRAAAVNPSVILRED
jgi:predicted permease